MMNEDSIGTKVSLVTRVSSDATSQRMSHDDPISDAPILGIDGVVHVTLSPAMQSMIDCIVHKNVSSEKPWRLVDKQSLEDIFETQEEMLEFSHVGEKLKVFPGSKVLIGYDAASKIDNLFFVCTTEYAQKAVEEMIKRQAEHLQSRVHRSIERPAGKWQPLGSEEEIDKYRVTKSRPLIVKSLLVPHSHSKCSNFEDTDVDVVTDIYSNPTLFDNIRRSQLNSSAQASPKRISSHVQTYHTFAVNMGTKPEFSIGNLDDTDFDNVSNFSTFLNEIEEMVSKKINQISMFDLYTDEFVNLVCHEYDESVPEKISLIEYQTLTNVKFCKGKMISSVSWHPMWVGIIAIAYTTTTRCTYISKDYTAQHGRFSYSESPVLIWNFRDTLQPKLILECPSEVHSIQFSTFNENLVAGGCENGQILIWDITNRLQNVDTNLPRNIMHAKCQQGIRNLMGWMKDTMLSIHVHPCASSSLQFSHRDCVVATRWLHPLWDITTGTFQSPLENTFLQFVTAGEDGVINFWDLKTSVVLPKKRARDSKRKSLPSRRPKIFDVFVSPFQALDQFLRPVFKIQTSTDLLKPLHISSMEFNVLPLKYEKMEISEGSLGFYTSKPILELPNVNQKKEITIGSFDGSVIFGSWEGHNTETNSLIKTEDLTQEIRGNVHGGPVFEILTSPFYDDIILSIGGKTFAIWMDSLPHLPVMWKASRVYLTGCAWSLHRPNMFFISKSDGSVELWDILVQSHKPLLIESISGGILTFISIKDLMLGVANYDGSFKVFNIPAMFVSTNNTEVENTKHLFERESLQRQNFYKWQSKWIEHLALDRKDTEEGERPVVYEETSDLPEIFKLPDITAKSKEKVLFRRSLERMHTWPQLTKDDMYKIRANFLETKDPRKLLQHRKKLVEKFRIPIVECLEEEIPVDKLSANKKQESQESHDSLPNVLGKLSVAGCEKLTLATRRLSSTAFPLLSEKAGNIRNELDSYKTEFLEQSKVIEEETLKYINSNPYSSYFDWRRLLLGLDLYSKEEN